MKILVTGGAGFIGSHIVDSYIKKGHEVVVIDNLSHGNLENINPKAKFYQTDITNSKKIEGIFSREKIDILNHHAAQLNVIKSIEHPAFDAESNIIGTLNLLQNCMKKKVKKVIFASSGGAIYGECNNLPANETSEIKPISPYGISKRASELYLDFYNKTFGLEYLTLRYSNVYGPRQDSSGEGGVVAIFSQKMLNGQEIEIFGDGEQLRDYIFVEDIIKANILGLTDDNVGIVNIGTQKSTSVNSLFNTLKGIADYNKKSIYRPSRPGEIKKSFLNIEKAKKTLGWQPEISLEEGLKRTFGYLKTQLNKNDKITN